MQSNEVLCNVRAETNCRPIKGSLHSLLLHIEGGKRTNIEVKMVA